jgi:acyl carrier protein
MNTEAVIEQFITQEILFGDNRKKLDSDESLLSSGILDSMALIRLVFFIEERFDVIVEDGELIPDNFETIHLIKEFIQKKRGENTTASLSIYSQEN